MKKRIFDMQKTIKEVTITLDFDDYINLMATLKTISDGVSSKFAAQHAKTIMNIIEEIDPTYIWND